MGRKWRHYENRMLKKYWKTERRLQAVQSQGGGCDGKGQGMAIELFQRDIPKYIKEELQQAIDDAVDDKTGEELLPIAVMREKYKPDDDSIVIIRLKDFREWYLE